MLRLKTHNTNPILTLLFLLILSSLSLATYNLISHVSQVNISTQAQNKTSSELATLVNNDLGYTVKYPANFNAIYTQSGVEFTPKKGDGKIILQIQDQIADVSINQNKIDPPQLTILNNASQTIKNTLVFVETTPIDKTQNQGRFANIHFDPRKY